MKLSEPISQEPSEKTKETKSTSIINAVFIGVLIGIVIFGVAKNGFGFFAVVPLYFIYKLVNKPESKDVE